VSIKGEGKEFSRDEHKTDVFSTSAINISSNTPPYFYLETWDWFPLSQVVTPYASTSVQGNTILSSSAGRRAFFARTRINLRIFSLHHHPD
jgi:hypothetical protein